MTFTGTKIMDTENALRKKLRFQSKEITFRVQYQYNNSTDVIKLVQLQYTLHH